MSFHIPIFFLPISEDEVPASLGSWTDAEDFIAAKREQGIGSGLREVTSQNGWYVLALDAICHGSSITGLEFINDEIIVLKQTELQSASEGMSHLLDQIRNGIPPLGDYENSDIADLRANPDAFQIAEPDFIIDDWEMDEIIGFYAFVKSLRACIDEALEADQYLLYVQPTM